VDEKRPDHYIYSTSDVVIRNPERSSTDYADYSDENRWTLKASQKGESRAAIPGSNQGTAERPGSDEGRLQTGLGGAAFVF
jgi:hypothetical protein